jgi:hypothetical protein
MKLITELSHNIEFIVEESEQKGKSLYITGIYSTADQENNNKRIYSKDILEREIGKLEERLTNRSLWGELGHPPNPEINPDKIAILTEKLDWDGPNVIGRSKVLDTPMGNIAKTLIKEGRMGISSRGLGSVNENGYVNEDFYLITWDMVTDPSNHPSWVNGIYEGQDFEPPKKEKVVEEPVIEQPKISLKEAQKEYYKKIWQVIADIERGMK